MQRELRTLAYDADEDQQRDRRQGGRREAGDQTNVRVQQTRDVEVSRRHHYEKDANQQTHITDACHQERLARRFGGGGFLIPEADQEEGCESHQLPEDEGLQQIDSINETEHGPLEEGEQGEVAGLRRIVGHVTDGIDDDTKGDQRHGDAEHQIESVEEKAEVEIDGATGEPQISQGLCGTVEPELDGASQSDGGAGRDHYLRQLRSSMQEKNGDHESGEGREGRRQDQGRRIHVSASTR